MKDDDIDNLLAELAEEQQASSNPSGISDEEYLQALLAEKAKRKMVTHAIHAKQIKGESEEKTLARYALMPEMNSVQSIQRAMGYEFCGTVLDINVLKDELDHQTEKIRNKDLSRAGDMLASQAHTLDLLFNMLMSRSIANMGEYPKAAEAYMKMAFKAQSQCRNTWEAVSVIQNPPLAGYAKQLNVAHNQQVNNDGLPSHGENQNQPIQLLEKTDGKRMDAGAQRAPVKDDSSVEALGEKHWPKVT